MNNAKAGFTALAVSAALLAAGTALADPADGRVWDYHGMMGWGGWFYGPIMMVIFFALLIGAVVLILRLLGVGTSSGPASGNGEDRALQILRERFARGEISEEEYRKARDVL